METKILKVVKCGEMFTVKSEKSENGQLNKRNLVLKELGGKYENEYAVAVLGSAATLQFYENDELKYEMCFADAIRISEAMLAIHDLAEQKDADEDNEYIFHISTSGSSY